MENLKLMNREIAESAEIIVLSNDLKQKLQTEKLFLSF